MPRSRLLTPRQAALLTRLRDGGVREGMAFYPDEYLGRGSRVLFLSLVRRKLAEKVGSGGLCRLFPGAAYRALGEYQSARAGAPPVG